MSLDRRTFLKNGRSSAALTPACRASSTQQRPTEPETKADYTIRIGTGLVDLAPGHIVSTTLYNDQFPGPLLRFKEGQRVVVDVFNDTDTPELVHWHGQMVPSDVDGASEEGTPFVPAHGMRRIAFVPRPSGIPLLSHACDGGADLNRGTYTGQAGPVYIEPKENAGAYDREVFLVLKEFEPSWSRGGDMPMDMLAGAPLKACRTWERPPTPRRKGTPKGFEAGYELFSINGQMRGHGEPIRVKSGERVLFHVLNASATEIRSLALPGHTFRVVALDGNPVPTPATVPVLVARHRRAHLRHRRDDASRRVADGRSRRRRPAQRGMGIVVEYAGREAARRNGPSRSRFAGTTRGSANRGDARRAGRDDRDHHRQAQCRGARVQPSGR